MAPSIKQKPFGALPDGREAPLFVLRDGLGFEAEVFPLGAAVRAIRCSDRGGGMDDVALGFDSPAKYLTQQDYCGVTAGRVAGRIPNARFTLGGETFLLPQNNGPNHLHGGRKLWTNSSGMLSRSQATGNPLEWSSASTIPPVPTAIRASSTCGCVTLSSRQAFCALFTRRAATRLPLSA